MRAGRLRHRVWLDQPVSVRDGFGAEAITYTPFAEVWASVEPIKGKELVVGGVQQQASVEAVIYLRWSPALAVVDARWRVRFGATVYKLVAPPVEANMGHRELQLAVVTEQPGA